MEALIPRKDESHGAPRRYPEELRERAIRMAVELRRDPATRTGALRRANEILRTASAFFAAAELDRKLK
jgi:transposase